MNVLFFWEPVGGLTLQHRCNPYAALLAQALERHDVYLDLGDYEFPLEWLREQRATHDVLHLNWLHGFYRRDDLESTVAAYHRFAENLHAAKRLGYRIVWTLHNLYPHERPFADVDHMARLLVGDLADVVLAHCELAARAARERFYCRDVRVVPHGNFIDAYPNEIPREQARARLGLPPSAFVYLFFGTARGYKSIQDLIEAFAVLDDGDAVLVLAMHAAADNSYLIELKDLAAADERVRVFTSGYFPPEELQLYQNSADVVVLPFSEVLTSGSAITALGFRRPIIVPRLGCLPELVDDSVGILFDRRAPGALAEAMRQIRQRNLPAMEQAAYARARQLDWGSIAATVADLYRG